MRRKISLGRAAVGVVGTVGILLLFLLHSYAAEESVKPNNEPSAKAKKKEQASGFKFDKEAPIVITSDRMELDRKKGRVTYTGRVVAVQGEMTMRSQTLTASYSEDLKKMKQIVAEGNVHIIQTDRIATGSKSVFNGDAQTITLTGTPAMVKQGNNEVIGPRIIFFIEEDRAIAEGEGSDRIKATIFPEELKKKEKAGASASK
ncbi:MAG: lipopolysaccharide transport periplasmic protein LptA [Candidatus Binatia bacterium]